MRRRMFLAVTALIFFGGGLAASMFFSSAGDAFTDALVPRPKEPPAAEYQVLLGESWRQVFGDTGYGPAETTPDRSAKTAQTETLTELLKTFDTFPVYWVGQEFEGLPLSSVVRLASPETMVPEDNLTIHYGVCDPGSEGCSPPLQIRIEPYCYRPQELLAPEATAGSLLAVRGAEALSLGPEGLVIWTGTVAVTISASSAEQAMRVADTMVAANGLGPTKPEDLLPSPNKDCTDFVFEPHPALQ